MFVTQIFYYNSIQTIYAIDTAWDAMLIPIQLGYPLGRMKFPSINVFQNYEMDGRIDKGYNPNGSKISEEITKHKHFFDIYSFVNDRSSILEDSVRICTRYNILS